MAATKPPAGLGEAGRALWRSISDPIKAWQLNPAEKAVLARACRVADRIADLDKEYDGLGTVISSGYMGQEVEHPVLSALTKHDALLQRLLGSLKLPDLQTGATPASTKARGGEHALVEAEGVVSAVRFDDVFERMLAEFESQAIASACRESDNDQRARVGALFGRPAPVLPLWDTHRPRLG